MVSQIRNTFVLGECLYRSVITGIPQLTNLQVLLRSSICLRSACWRWRCCRCLRASGIFEGTSLLEPEKCVKLNSFNHHRTDTSFQIEPLFLSCAETDHTFNVDSRRRAVDILIEGNKSYQLQVFSRVEHGFALRGDMNNPYERQLNLFLNIT